MTAVLVVLAVLAVAGCLGWRLKFARRPIAKLTLREGQVKGLEFPITTTEVTIGSEEGQTVVISDPRVSRQHATLTFEDDRFVLRDCSRHGVRVNGSPCRETILKSGDLIRLGESVDVIFTRLK